MNDWFERWFGVWSQTMVNVLIAAGLYLLIVVPIWGVAYYLLYVYKGCKKK